MNLNPICETNPFPNKTPFRIVSQEGKGATGEKRVTYKPKCEINPLKKRVEFHMRKGRV